MKNQFLFPVAAGIGGAVGLVLRLWQNMTGFEAETGLPIPGNLPGLALMLWLALTAAALLLLSRRLPKAAEAPPAFPADFSTRDAGLLMLPVAGVFLMALSGAVDILVALEVLTTLSLDLPGLGTLFLVMAPRHALILHLLAGVLSLVSAGALMLAIVACRSSGKRAAPFTGTALLIPVVTLVVQLVLTYRVDTLNPSAEVYYVELLALTALLLGFSQLSSFAFSAGRPRTFSLCVGLSVVLTLTLLSDGSVFLSSRLLYLGGAAVLLGLLILLLAEPSAPANAAETIE